MIDDSTGRWLSRTEITAMGWKNGSVPDPAPGLVVNAFASGLQHPRWLEVLPNGDVLVAEATIWTLFWWDGARLATPALGLGILPGVARARLAVLAGGLGEREVLAAGLKGRSLFVANAARSVVPVAELDGADVPADPRSSALAAAFWP